jgi:Tetratricopeptide repeat
LKSLLKTSSIIAAFLIFSTGIALSAENPTTPVLAPGYSPELDRNGVLEQANEFYRNGDLPKALSGYQYLTALGIKNGYLFYNLGNAYFREGNLGSAILWYERALLYLPRFHDLNINYQYARTVLADEEFKAPEYSGTLGFLIHINQKFNLRECLIITGVFLWLFLTILIIRMFLENQSFRSRLSIPCWVVGFAFIIFFSSSVFKVYQHESIRQAIVMAPAVEVKTGPGNDFSTSFSIHEGTKVKLLQDQGDWVRVLLPGNTTFTGWMLKSTVEAI